ncbi:MAG: hypothetical protein IKX33_08980 [Prevotella sp.]|nr:hypothetical protein [Prevotella sp.]
MKKLLFGLFALVLCMGLTSCGGADLKSIAEKAKTEGANWSVDEWKAQIKSALTAAKPMMEEIKALQAEAENAGEDVSKAAEIAGKLADFMKKNEGEMNALEELMGACEKSENGKKLMEDKAFEEEIKKEFGDMFGDF